MLYTIFFKTFHSNSESRDADETSYDFVAFVVSHSVYNQARRKLASSK